MKIAWGCVHFVTHNFSGFCEFSNSKEIGDLLGEALHIDGMRERAEPYGL